MHDLLNQSLFYSRIHFNLVFRKDSWSIVHVSVSLLVHRISLLFQSYHMSNYTDLLYSIYTLPFHVQLYMYIFIVYLMLIDDAWFGHTRATFLSFERRSQIRWEKRQKQKVPNDKNVITHFQYLNPLIIIWVVKFVNILHGKLLASSRLCTLNYLPDLAWFSRPATPEETTFHLLHLSLFREYLDFEFASLKVSTSTYNTY